MGGFEGGREDGKEGRREGGKEGRREVRKENKCVERGYVHTWPWLHHTSCQQTEHGPLKGQPLISRLHQKALCLHCMRVLPYREP